MSVNIEIKGVSKHFGDVVAVDNASFDIPANRFVSIIGPSGCGKSTLLRVVSGLSEPTCGEVLIGGVPVSGPAKDTGMVFQSPVLLPWRTTLDNVLLTCEMSGAKPEKYRQRAMELIALAGLTGFENSYPHQLSGGMQQRAGICRALLLNPALILMDEPFGALDVITRERMGFELLKIWAHSRNTVLFVTHSITEAILLSDTVIVMSPRPGRVQDVVEINLPRPRTRETMRGSRFTELAERLGGEIQSNWSE
ncbi:MULTISPECIES: ABC transporter ATP-binding protein [Limibacillus]|jgi:NitT/TauT family transport system ATP-binding protein|uniref:NitT/TauT family transport system ATP-binding protein n=1 Tax=Limibacillus halophilus TaxID=1579333 RepID=A0A839SPG4_9PROT|nr:ABC transporter ATP-binding protein [Limibacillus halophilus]MBB3063754.1 NitT/TauT family transport system ATP-binding protein [Limibacillus halophilus]